MLLDSSQYKISLQPNDDPIIRFAAGLIPDHAPVRVMFTVQHTEATLPDGQAAVVALWVAALLYDQLATIKRDAGDYSLYATYANQATTYRNHYVNAVAGLLEPVELLKLTFNLPAEVPNAMLQIHVDAALRHLYSDVGIQQDAIPMVDGIPINWLAEWDEALVYRGYALAVPHLHLFSLQGASKAQRLSTQLEARFLDSREHNALVDNLMTHYRLLVDAIQLKLKLDEPENSTGIQWIAL